jgi:hypothetical protein
VLTESQLAALEKAKSEKEAHGEFESECPGYCGAHLLMPPAFGDDVRSAGGQGAYTGELYSGPHRFDVPMQEAAFEWLPRHFSVRATGRGRDGPFVSR